MAELSAREVLDCRGFPTLQAEVRLEGGASGRADVPAGRSTGRHEAAELRDGGDRFRGQGVRRAVESVRGEIASGLVGKRLGDQRALDSFLVELDGTADKSRLGANALLAISLASARAAASAHGLPLYRYLSADAHVLPVPQVNLINGGRHASNELDFQEFIVMPVGCGAFLEAMQLASEVNCSLREILEREYGLVALNVGDEGGFAPPIDDPVGALELLREAVANAGYRDDVEYGLDCAATHMLEDDGSYTLGGETRTRDELADLYERLARDYGVRSMEDPLGEEDFDGFTELTERLAPLGVQIVGDDLFVTNPERVRAGVERGAANALLWKVNQIGTLAEALDAATIAFRNGYSVVVSERSGETEDPIIADLAVALNAGQIKTGAPVRGERTAKYNRLLEIEDELGPAAVYPGRDYRAAV